MAKSVFPTHCSVAALWPLPSQRAGWLDNILYQVRKKEIQKRSELMVGESKKPKKIRREEETGQIRSMEETRLKEEQEKLKQLEKKLESKVFNFAIANRYLFLSTSFPGRR